MTFRHNSARSSEIDKGRGHRAGWGSAHRLRWSLAALFKGSIQICPTMKMILLESSPQKLTRGPV